MTLTEEINRARVMMGLNEVEDTNTTTIKDILTYPPDLDAIFRVCKHEIEISQNDMKSIMLYSKIYMDCVLTDKGLTHGNVDIINHAIEYLTSSLNSGQAERQYKEITKPTHVIPSDLLKMLNDYKKLRFSDEKLNKHYKVLDVLNNFIVREMTGVTHYSKTHIITLFKAPIIIEK